APPGSSFLPHPYPAGSPSGRVAPGRAPVPALVPALGTVTIRRPRHRHQPPSPVLAAVPDVWLSCGGRLGAGLVTETLDQKKRPGPPGWGAGPDHLEEVL